MKKILLIMTLIFSFSIFAKGVSESKEDLPKEKAYPVPCNIECGNYTEASKGKFCGQKEIFVAKKGSKTLDDVVSTKVQVCSVFYFNADFEKDYVDNKNACLREIKALPGESILEELPMSEFQETENRNCETFDLDFPDIHFPRGFYCDSKDVKITESGKLDVYSYQRVRAERQLKKLQDSGFCKKE